MKMKIFDKVLPQGKRRRRRRKRPSTLHKRRVYLTEIREI